MELPVTVMGEGESLLLIHGGISEASFFYGVMDRLKDRYRLIAYDRRGYGKAEAPADGDYTVQSQMEDAVRILTRHADCPAWVLGNSAGAMVAAELAILHPDLVRGLILMEPSLGMDEESDRKLREWNKKLNEFVKAGRIKKALPAFYDAFGPDDSVPDIRPEGTSLAEIKQTYRNLTTFMRGELNEVEGHRPSEEALRALPMPVCVMVSELGEHRLFGHTSKLGAEHMGWPLYRVPGNHNAFQFHPDESAEIIHSVISEMKNAEKKRCQV